MTVIPKENEVRTFLGSCIYLYEEMITEIKTCQEKNLPEEEQIQACFEIANNYMEQINATVRCYQFSEKSHEVFFFKKVKPLFTAEVQFFTYLYHIALFKTKAMQADKEELEQFYKRQLLKKEKIRKENPAFIKYIEEDGTNADLQWFTRRGHSSDSSLFDALMGKYLAIEKFELYLKNMMRRDL